MPEQETRDKIAQWSDEALCRCWLALEGKGPSEPLVAVREAMLDEMNRRLGDDLFGQWLDTVDSYGDQANPMTYFARKKNT